jgi:tetratricopeptide (TPR) repeat protein
MQRGDLLRGRFEVGEVVREGGMGVVFRARDRETGRDVAIKTLLEGASVYAERFERESALLSRLRHPAVVSYVAHGTSERGEPFLAMDWLEGEELTDRLARGPLPLAESRSLALRMAEALGAAHALGIVHRDVKPANVFLVGGNVARATLIDFGVALAASDGPRRTRTGLIIGTPGYMAPEQARASRVIDARADVYALGCVLFECLTGTAPFTGDHPVAVLAKVLIDDAPRLRSMARDAPADLDALLAAMLAKDPAERPADGNAVALALGAAPKAEPARATASVMPESITADERVVVHVILAARALDASDLGRTIVDASPVAVEEIERRFGVRVEQLADGSALATVRPGALGPKGGAVRAATVARELARELAAPVALASGLERMRRGAPLGEVVDRAAALSGAAARAGVKGVVTDELTTSLLRGAWGVRERDGLRMLEDAAVQSGPARRLVGREREVSTLVSLFDEVESEGASRVAVVTAPPGGGKTRLLAEVVDRVRARPEEKRILSARCDEATSQSPLALAADVARRVCGAWDSDAPEQRRERLATFLATTDLDDLQKRRVMDFVGDMIGATVSPSLALLAARTDAMTMSDQTQRAFVALLDACAERSSMLCIDDLQWCDRASFRLLEAAARELESKPLFLLALARPDFDDTFPTAFAERALARLSLASLGKRAAESLVRDLAGAETPDGVVAEVVARGEGNPFLLEELARGVREGRALDAASGSTALVAARFEALSAEARRVLRAASIVGQKVSPDAVAALLACEPNAPWLVHVWGELERAEVLGSRGGEVGFRHALLRDAAYATLTEEDKALGHKLAARYFDAAGGDPMVIAAHADRGGDRELAARAYVDAAHRALEISDLAGAIERATSAIRLGAAGELLGRAERVCAEASYWRGLPREIIEHGERAMAALDASSAGFFVAGGCCVLAYAALGQPEQALACTRRLVTSTAGSPHAAAARASALLRAVAQLAVSGQLELAGVILRETKATIDELAAADPLLPARYAQSRSLYAVGAGDLEGHIAFAREAAGRFAELGDRRNNLTQRAIVAYGLLELGDYAEAAAAGRAVIDEASRMGLQSVVAMTKQNTGLAIARAGDVDEGLRVLAEGAAESTAQGNARMIGGAQLYRAIVLADSGKIDEALPEIESALERLTSSPPARAHALAVFARLHLARGKTAEAKRAADEALAVLDSLGGLDSGESDVYLTAAQTRLAAGEEAGARTALRRGRDRIRARAARLGDAQRATFLGKVASNVALLELARRTLGEDDSAA